MVLTATGTHKSHIDSCDVSCRPERSEPTSFSSVQHVQMGLCYLTMFFSPFGKQKIVVKRDNH